MATKLNTSNFPDYDDEIAFEYALYLDLGIENIIVNIDTSKPLPEEFPSVMDAMYQARNLLKNSKGNTSLQDALMPMSDFAEENIHHFQESLIYLSTYAVQESGLFPHGFKMVIYTIDRIIEALRTYTE